MPAPAPPAPLSQLGVTPPRPPSPRWRAHPDLRVLAGPPLRLELGSRRWHLDGLDARSREWLLALGGSARPMPAPGQVHPPTAPDAAFVALVGWMESEGLALRRDEHTLLLVDTRPSEPRLASSLRGVGTVRRLGLAEHSGALPPRMELELHPGLVVIRGLRVDRALTWLAHRSRVDHVVVEADPEGCRVGMFTAGSPCLRCHDLREAAGRPLLAASLVQPVTRQPRSTSHKVPGWVDEWAATQVMLAWHRWRRWPDAPPTATWWWMRSDGTQGQQAVAPHPDCCGARARAAA